MNQFVLLKNVKLDNKDKDFYFYKEIFKYLQQEFELVIC